LSEYGLLAVMSVEATRSIVDPSPDARGPPAARRVTSPRAHRRRARPPRTGGSRRARAGRPEHRAHARRRRRVLYGDNATVKLTATNPAGQPPGYNLWAIETSAGASITDWPGGGVIGIHGTNQPWLIGRAVSHGCIRMRNADILRLRRWAKPGTGLRIHA
jgi:hypothetical protein